MTIIFSYYYYTIRLGVPSNEGIVLASSFERKSENSFYMGMFSDNNHQIFIFP